MPIVATDIVAYAALNKPIDDTSTNGGGVDLDERVVFTDLSVNDSVEVLSSSAADTTQQVTVTARLASGATVAQTVTLTGVTPVVLSTMGVVQRIQRGLLNADAAGIVTVRRAGAAGDIAAIPIGERGFRRMFINAFSIAASPKVYYEKLFIRNNHATLALLTAIIKQNADPTALVTFLLAASKNDSATSANRLTPPAAGDTLNPDTFDDTDKSVPGTDLGSGEGIGCWLALSLAAANAPIDSTFTLQADGSTT